ncbi:MAG: hypothetical protein EGR12_01545, partial [Coprococcus catus]|nr:hypothetical protein [Coprococcus catus]
MINEQIRDREIRLIGEDGEQLGIMSARDAMKLAREANLDLVLGNDITSPVAIHEMDKMTVDTVFNKDKIALVMDHFIPNKDIKSAEHCKCVREFACRHEITNYFDVGEMGIEHALLPEKG